MPDVKPGEETSSGKPGFHSNADHEAKLTYTAVNQVGDHKTETLGSVEYDHPVLRVKTGKIQVTKNWDPAGSAPTDDTKVTVNVYKGTDNKGVHVGTLELGKSDTPADNWTGSLGNLAPGTYFVEEANVDGYTASYSQSQTVNITAADLWTAAPNMTKFDNVKTYGVAITNTLNRVDLDVNANVKVHKTVQGAVASRDFTFNLTCATGNAACEDGVTWPKDSNDSLTATVSKDALQTIDTPADAEFPKGSTLQLKAPTGTDQAVYEFRVSENQSGKSAGWKYDTDVVTVRVTVSKKADGSGYETKVEYVYAGGDSDKTDNPTSADFTNTYVAVSSLPLTGGKSARDWLIYGGGLGLMALLAAAGYTVWRKRQLV
ncbi:MAG: FctA domain-containing protein [Bifidobacterium longum]